MVEMKDMYYKSAFQVNLEHGKEDQVKEATEKVLKNASDGDKIKFNQRAKDYTVESVKQDSRGIRVKLSNGGVIEPTNSIYQYMTEKEATDTGYHNYGNGILITGVELNGCGPEEIEEVVE